MAQWTLSFRKAFGHKGFGLATGRPKEPKVGWLVEHYTRNRTLWSVGFALLTVSQTLYWPKQYSNYNVTSQVAWLQEQGMPEQWCLYSSWPGSSTSYQMNKSSILAHISAPCDSEQHKPVFLALINSGYLIECGFYFRKTEHKIWTMVAKKRLRPLLWDHTKHWSFLTTPHLCALPLHYSVSCWGLNASNPPYLSSVTPDWKCKLSDSGVFIHFVHYYILSAQNSAWHTGDPH